MDFRCVSVYPRSSPYSKSARPDLQAFADIPFEFDIFQTNSIPVEFVDEIDRLADRSRRHQAHEARQESAEFGRIVFFAKRADVDRPVQLRKLIARTFEK